MANGEHYRLINPLIRRDEDGNLYDLTRVMFEEYAFHPFSPRDDFIDAMSRVYDMEPMQSVHHEVVHVDDYVDS